MTDIVAFLTARLDERQAAAEAAQAVDPGPWTVRAVPPERPFREAEAGNRSGHGAAVVVAADGTELWDTYDSDYGDDQHAMAVPTAQHAALHDPPHVLREVAAKRRVLARHFAVNVYGSQACDGCGSDREDGYHVEDIEECPELRDMASVYVDHPDYDPAWRME